MLMPYLDIVFQVEEDKQLDAMLWPKFSDGKHSLWRGVLYMQDMRDFSTTIPQLACFVIG